MRITFDPRAADDLLSQIDYLIEQNAINAAERLKTRCDAFFEHFLVRHPRSGKQIPQRNLWETWIPGTRLIIWYRFTDDELQILRVWHSAQDRENG